MKNHAKFIKALKKLLIKNQRLSQFCVMDLVNDSITVNVSTKDDRNVVRDLKNLFTGKIESEIAWIVGMRGSVFIYVKEHYIKVLVKDESNKTLVNHEETFECEESA